MGATSIEQIVHQMTLRFYPNPVEKMIVIENLSGKIFEYQIFDLMGRRVADGFSDKMKYVIDVSNLKRGHYIQVLKTPSFEKREKLIKK